MKRIVRAAWVAASLFGTGLHPLPVAAQDSLSLPNLAFRTGPFADSGTALMNGQRDYITMINERDGGVNGVTLGYEECETASSTEKGMECYGRAKATGLIVQPWSPALALQLLSGNWEDKVPLLAPGYGYAPMADGRTFGWGFNPPVTAYDGASIMLSAISAGKPDSLKGKSIALIYPDGPFGDDALPLFDKSAAQFGFALAKVPVATKEMQNPAAQWQAAAASKPDIVLLWGWGSMNATVLAEAIKAGFPADRIVGFWWSAHDGDLIAAGPAAKGYRALSWNMPVLKAEVLHDVERYVVAAGKSTRDDARGEGSWVLYQRGLVISMMSVEAIRLAQQKFNRQLINGEQMRWGLENLDLSAARLKDLGVEGMIAPFKLSCADHAGHSGAWLLAWDGQKFTSTSDLIAPDASAVKALEATGALDFAMANKPWPTRGCT